MTEWSETNTADPRRFNHAMLPVRVTLPQQSNGIDQVPIRRAGRSIHHAIQTCLDPFILGSPHWLNVLVSTALDCQEAARHFLRNRGPAHAGRASQARPHRQEGHLRRGSKVDTTVSARMHRDAGEDGIYSELTAKPEAQAASLNFARFRTEPVFSVPASDRIDGSGRLTQR